MFPIIITISFYLLDSGANINHIDYKFALIVGTKLDLFEPIGNDTFNFRCPFCQDSKKNKFKKRGYLYPKDDTLSFKCHNCGVPHLFPTFLKLVDFNLYTEYKLEKFGNLKSKPNPNTIISDKMILLKKRELDPLAECVKLSEITDELLPVKQYVTNRGIPEHLFNYLYATKSLNLISSRIDKYKERLYPEFPVLVIPFFRVDGSYSYIQCRTITDHGLRFTTFEVDSLAPKLWGEFRIDWNKTVYILEGPIDAMFIDNGVALAGASVHSTVTYIKTNQQLHLGGEVDLSKLCFAFDNDYIHNDQILSLLIKKIEEGFSVLLYDNRFKWKDINDAYSKGNWSIEDINKYIASRTFRGLKAKLELAMLTKR